MRSFGFILLFLCCTAAYAQQKKPQKKIVLKYWEDMSQKERDAMLADSTLSKDVLALYNNAFVFTDSKATTALFKALTWDKENNLPLRFYLFNKLIASGDTSLNKYLTEYSAKMLLNQTDFAVKYFNRERLKKNSFYKKYIPFLAADLDEKNEYGTFRDYLNYFFYIEKNDSIKQTVAILLKELEAAGAGKK
ncbi:MAG: hypothetical protein AB1458_09895 [Bacteroidota bacterium]